MKGKSQYIKIVVAVGVALVLWMLPPTLYGMPDVTLMERRMLAIMAYSLIMWVTEAVPLWTTSVSVIMLMLLLVSNDGFYFLNEGIDPYTLGQTVPFKDIMGAFADPVLILFLGGFSLATAASAVGLDVKLAKSLLKLLGDKSEGVLLGFMIVTATLSMFINNTATTALMLSIILPVLRSLPHKSTDKLPLILSIPIAANLGGMATPMGTPSNMLAYTRLNDPNGFNLGFTYSEWMFYMLPLAVFMVFISWLLLSWMFPFHHKNLSLDIHSDHEDTGTQVAVAATFFVTVALWIFQPFVGLNMYIVGLLPMTVFLLLGIMGRAEIRHIDWEIIWLVAGGIALSIGMEQTHLAHRIIKMIPFADMDPWVLAMSAGLLCFVMSTFISNSITTKLMLAILPSALASNTAVGGDTGIMTMVIMGVAASASLAMPLPISTTPNALVYSMEGVSQKDMAKVGILIGLVGMVVTSLLFGYLSFADYV